MEITNEQVGVGRLEQEERSRVWQPEASTGHGDNIITCVCFLFSSCGGKYPGGGYMALELFFVSARTNKRHIILMVDPKRVSVIQCDVTESFILVFVSERTNKRHHHHTG